MEDEWCNVLRMNGVMYARLGEYMAYGLAGG